MKTYGIDDSEMWEEGVSKNDLKLLSFLYFWINHFFFADQDFKLHVA